MFDESGHLSASLMRTTRKKGGTESVPPSFINMLKGYRASFNNFTTARLFPCMTSA
jgi:hypothetical protein